MIQTVEAVVEATGRVQLLGEVNVGRPRRALVTVLEEPTSVPGEAALLAGQLWRLTGPGRRRTRRGHTCTWGSNPYHNS